MSRRRLSVEDESISRSKISFSLSLTHTHTHVHIPIALTQRIQEAKCKIEADRKARIAEKLRPIESKNADLESKLSELTLEDSSLKDRIAELQAREKDIIAELKLTEATAEVESRRMKNTVSLYVNSCTVGWDHDTPNTIFCSNKASGSVETMTLTPEISAFETAGRLWEMMGL